MTTLHLATEHSAGVSHSVHMKTVFIRMKLTDVSYNPV